MLGSSIHSKKELVSELATGVAMIKKDQVTSRDLIILHPLKYSGVSQNT